MSDIAFRVENLGKQYRIGGPQARYRTIRETLIESAQAPFRRAAKLLRGQAYGAAEMDETIWALKDVSLEVRQGEVVGIIGRNGAGKTTLLKILSRITEPTEGQAEIYGRVGSLLEVGTGFHPELTGRENIHLNGAILGMKRAEIDRKFDEIVDFAEIEKFIDTPVKHYSSGMYVRLAFAVAAHLEPEVLLVDEVLAVGDVAFQKKCLGKMGEVASAGRTVLFVSHNMAAIENLCQRGIVLNHGGVEYIGGQTEAIAQYLRSLGGQTRSLRDLERGGSGLVRVVDIGFRDVSGKPLEVLQTGQDVDICLYYETSPSYAGGWVHVGITVSTQLGVKVFSQSTRMTGTEFRQLSPSGAFVCRILRLPLPPSMYRLSFNIKVNEMYADAIAEAVDLTVVEGNFFSSGQVPAINLGVCLVDGRWRCIKHETSGATK
jgi:lipopolysaccharide transport system ATP-binding protein